MAFRFPAGPTTPSAARPPALRNIISGNSGDGVEITGPGTTGNVVDGNYIGVNKDGESFIQGTVAWYKGEGNAADVTRHHDGTLLGNPSFGTGLVGQTFDFDGVNDTVQVPMTSNLELATGDFTIEAWVNFTALPGYMQIVRAYNGNPVFLLQTTPDGKAGFFVRNSSGQVDLVGSSDQ